MGHHRVARDDGVHVCAEMCSSCIFRPGNLMRLQSGRVRGMVDQAVANESCIPCHKTIYDEGPPAICRGFFDRFGDRVWPLRLARLLDRIVFDPPPKEQ